MTTRPGIGPNVSEDLATELDAAREEMWSLLADPTILALYGDYRPAVEHAIAERTAAALQPSSVVYMEDNGPLYLAHRVVIEAET